eukprot:8601770-Ditylum_brightwellii.AAC.1
MRGLALPGWWGMTNANDGVYPDAHSEIGHSWQPGCGIIPTGDKARSGMPHDQDQGRTIIWPTLIWVAICPERNNTLPGRMCGICNAVLMSSFLQREWRTA